jgi:hypothetical protein
MKILQRCKKIEFLYKKETKLKYKKKMPIYFGIRVTIRDAFRLFSENYQKIFDDTIVSFEDTRHMDSYLCETLNKIAEMIKDRPINAFNMGYKITKLIVPPSVNVFYIGNEQCVIGWEMEKISANIDDFILILINLKAKFSNVTNYFKFLHNEEFQVIYDSEPSIIEYNK